MNMVKEQLSSQEKQEAIAKYEAARKSTDQQIRFNTLIVIRLDSGKKVRVVCPDNITKFKKPHYRVLSM